MALVKCMFGHYYDNSKHKNCPMCQKMEATGSAGVNMQSQVTVSGYKLGTPTGGATELLSDKDINIAILDNIEIDNSYDAMADSNSTIGYFDISGIGNFVAGWLVCISGKDKGKSFNIEIGRNVCGSSSANDICITDDDMVSYLHCSFVYEPKQNKFFLTPDKGAVFYNGKFIKNPVTLKNDDRITLGSSELVFVPFCNKNRSWNE